MRPLDDRRRSGDSARSGARALPAPVAALAVVALAVLAAIPGCRSTPAVAVPATPPASSEDGRPTGAVVTDGVGKVPEKVAEPGPAGEAQGAEDDDSTIRGRVLDADGRPLAGASVVVFEETPIYTSRQFKQEVTADAPWNRQVASGTSGPDGTFRMTDLGQADYTVRVTLPGFRAVETKAHPDHNPVVEVRLVPFAPIEGRIVGAQGQPLAHGTVRLYPDPESKSPYFSSWTWGRPPLSRAEADSEGRFRLAVGVERNALVADAPGHAPAVIYDVGEGVEGEPEPVLRLAPGLSLAGQVVDAEGRALEGAQVSLEGSGLILQRETYSARLPDLEAVTDGRGEFAFDGLEDRMYHLLVGHPEYAWKRLSASLERTGETMQVVLQRGEAIEGRVVDALTSSPIAGARVSMEVSGFPEKACVTDADGMYRISGFERTAKRGLVLRAEAEGYRSERREVRDPWEGGFDTNLALEPLASARGLVTDLKGIRVPRAKVRCSSYPTRPARTDARGEFLLGGLLPSLEITLHVRHPSFLPQRIELADLQPGQVVDLGTLRLSRGGMARGRVVGPAGRPLEGVLVGASPVGSAWKPEFPALSSVTDAAGEFAVARIPPGSHDLTAWHESAVEASIRGIEIRGEECVEGIVIQLSTGRELRGEVLSDGGKPVPGAAIRVYDFGRGFRLLESRTDAKGRFAVRGIAARDRVELRAEHPEHGSFASLDVPLGAGDVTIRLSRGGK